MRRVNIRKRNKITTKYTNKKSLQLVLAFIIILIVCILIYVFFLQNLFVKKNFEETAIGFSNLNENIPFSLRKIVLFSSATATTEDINQSILNLDISQYCDIGIYLDNSDSDNTFIKSLYIDQINISTPEVGTPFLYKKNINDLGKCSFDENNIIENNFYFNVVNSTSEINYSNYEIFNDGSTPLSLGFYNKNIKENFLTDKQEVLYDGSLLNDAIIPTTSIKCNVSFVINIITDADEHYMCNVNFDIPFENDGNTIYDNGYVTKVIDNKQLSSFIRLK